MKTMKKIVYIFSALLLLLMGSVSCNVTREPEVTPKQKPFENLKEAQMNRDAVYALLREVESPNNLDGIEIQGDLYHLTFLDNNSLYGLYRWQRQSVQDHDVILSYYANFYSVLMQANYFMMRAEELKANNTLIKTDDDRALLDQYVAEMKVIRALAHWRLIQRFSKPWDGKTDDEPYSGILMQTEYKPLENAQAKKASRKAVYDQILKDLDEAIATLKPDANKEVTPAIYLTRDYAFAVKARACLTKQDWAGAYAAAKEVMDAYPLKDISSMGTGDKIAEVEKLWRTEDSPEILVRLKTTSQFGAFQSLIYAGSLQMTYVNDNDPNDVTMEQTVFRTPALILEQWVIDLYDSMDPRKAAYIGKEDFYYEGTGIPFYTLTKFKGNPSLDKDPKKPEFKLGVHLFNAGEAYLIAAEAATEQGNIAEAIDAIKQLRLARGASFDSDALQSREDVRKFVREERVRELVGEGFHFNDLVRWRVPVKRGESQQSVEAVAEPFGIDATVQLDDKYLTVPLDNPMYIWEFPTRDLENNANLREYRNWK